MPKFYKQLSELYWLAASLEYKNPKAAKAIYEQIMQIEEERRK